MTQARPPSDPPTAPPPAPASKPPAAAPAAPPPTLSRPPPDAKPAGSAAPTPSPTPSPTPTPTPILPKPPPAVRPAAVGATRPTSAPAAPSQGSVDARPTVASQGVEPGSRAVSLSPVGQKVPAGVVKAGKSGGVKGGGVTGLQRGGMERGVGGGRGRLGVGSGVSRQVFHLTGGRTPASVVPAVPAGVRSMPSRKRAWVWREFGNSARADGLRLSHWSSVGGGEGDYVFARFNKGIRMIEYSEKEYGDVVEGLKPLNLRREEEGEGGGDVSYVRPQKEWTKEETDMVFRLVKEYDMRFVVVADRWPEEWPSRGIDEIKDRYYSVAKALIESRGWMDNEEKMAQLPVGLQKHCHSIMMNPFDYEYESVRKNQLHVQYHRSKTEMREEEETVREARRIEQSRKRSAKERTRLAKLLTPAGDIVGGRAKGVDPSRAVAAASQPQKTFPHRKVASGAYARSGMIYTPVTNSAKLSRRIDEALVELGVGLRPTPTSIVVDNFDLLRMEIMHFIELQRTVMRKEEEVHLLRVKLAKLKGSPTPLPPQGVVLSHKKRRADDIETGSLFGGPPPKQQKMAR